MKPLRRNSRRWILPFLWVFPFTLCHGQNLIEGKEIVLDANTPWIVEDGQPEAVQRALNDVMVDWYKVFGHTPVVLKEMPVGWDGPLIYLGLKGAWRGYLKADKFDGPEHFILRTQRKENGQTVIVVTGADVRGSIYAVYSMAEDILGVDPWYYWVDKEPVRKTQIRVAAGFNKNVKTPTFKYRGWFINDEDLLNGFAPDPIGENVFSLQMYDKIYETLLRLKGNMIVPATFPFPDERCQELAARRGLVLNMHHILVLGLNTYRWPKDVPFSYDKHPEIMEKYWQTCIDAFKDYETVWTVGYRGKHDRPFWRDEPDLKTPEARGEVITKAIAKQVEMIRKKHPDAQIISNLWDEGAEMFHKGHLRLPEGITVVWPDNGAGLIRDRSNIPAWPGAKIDSGGKLNLRPGHGIYYHTAMVNHHANQLTEMVNPALIYREIGRFVEAKATEFFLVNVSDIRPVPLTTDCVMQYVWDARPYEGKTPEQSAELFLRNWVRRQLGTDHPDKIARLYNEYFNIPYQREGSFAGENTINTRIHNLHLKALPLIEKKSALTNELLDDCRKQLSFSKENIAYLSKLESQVHQVIAKVPEKRRNFFNGHLVTQMGIHLHLNYMLNAYCQSLLDHAAGNKTAAISHAARALQASNKVFEVLQRAEYGKWTAFYGGEGVVRIGKTNDQIRVLLARLNNLPSPPVRALRGYPEIESYQLKFLDNFPLLYPDK